MSRWFLTGNRCDQAVEIEGTRAAGGELLLRSRPTLPWTVGRELDPVAVRIGQVDGLVGAVIGRTLDRRAGGGEAKGSASELLARGIEQRVVVEAGVTSSRLGLGILVQDERGFGAVAKLCPRRAV